MAMSVGELIEELKKMPFQNHEVILASDPEGNEFLPVDELGIDEDAVIIWPHQR